MYRDPDADPPALVCQVGSTTLKYHLQAIEDLHAWLVEQGGWVPLGAAVVIRAVQASSQCGGAVRPAGTTVVLLPLAESSCAWVR